jgi:hypothetical protein
MVGKSHLITRAPAWTLHHRQEGGGRKRKIRQQAIESQGFPAYIMSTMVDKRN